MDPVYIYLLALCTYGQVIFSSIYVERDAKFELRWFTTLRTLLCARERERVAGLTRLLFPNLARYISLGICSKAPRARTCHLLVRAMLASFLFCSYIPSFNIIMLGLRKCIVVKMEFFFLIFISIELYRKFCVLSLRTILLVTQIFVNQAKIFSSIRVITVISLIF